MKKFVADFETTTDPEDCRVWACGLYDMEDDAFLCGQSIEWLFESLREYGDAVVYFHNLKFDGAFLLPWFFRNGYHHVTKKKLNPGEFNTLISDKNQFYQFKIKLFTGEQYTIIDSLKIIPFSVRVIAKSFGLPMSKGEIDYSYPRPVGWEITAEEADYIERDCRIVGMALNILHEQELTRGTQGSNALMDFKKTLDRDFKRLFPVPEYDKEIRAAYRGGYTYVNPRYQGRNIGKGIVLDKNSMYPSVMKYKMLPFDEPIRFSGKYKESKWYPLYIQAFSCIFELKKGKLPTIQIKSGYAGFVPTEYVESSNGDEITLCLTNVDLKLFLEHYEIIGDITWKGGFMFRGKVGLFDTYIDKWYKVKEEATRTGNKGMRTLAKLMLNALYGKFALTPEVQSKIPYMDEETGIVKYKLGEMEHREPIYLPVACFITAYSREDVIRNAQANYDRFLYCDTDSLHLIGMEIPANMDIDPYRLGAWDKESAFFRARYLRAKCYIEYNIKGFPKVRSPYATGKWVVSRETKYGTLYNTEKAVTCAGMPADCHVYVDWNNFLIGSEFPGKKRFATVKGGAVLLDTPYKIKEHSI